MRRALALGLAAIAGLAGGCSRPTAFTADSLLLVSVDALRADRLGCGGDPVARTPFWDRLARQGAQFADVVAAAPLTLPSHATLLTGEHPFRHGARENGSGAFAPRGGTLAEILSAAGLATAGFAASPELGASTGLARGFDTYGGPRARDGAAATPVGDVVRDALAWIDGVDARRGFFLFVHAHEPHGPREPPAPWDRVFPADPYRGEVAAADRGVGTLLRGLDERGRLARTLVLATSDHGEAFGEHGETGHGKLVYETTLAVPLAAWGPLPFRGGRVRPDLARGVDVFPTALAAFRIGVPAKLPGRRLQERRKAYKEALYDAYAETAPAPGRAAELRAYRLGSWKYVRGPREELYDLAADPGELSDRAADEPGRLASLAAALDELVGTDPGASARARSAAAPSRAATTTASR